MYGSERILWKEEERTRIRAVQMDNLKGLLSIVEMDRVPNSRVRELCGVKKGLDERIDEGELQWFGHEDRMESDRIAKRVCISVCWQSFSGPWKRWTDTLKAHLRKRGLDVRQAKRMVQDRSEWRRFVRGNTWGVAQGMNP